jgi:hypothetical protein
VDYFAHGRVTESYMRAQRNRYLKLWPTRNYSLVGPVSIKPVSSDSALVDFTLSYRLQRGQHRAAGRRGNRVTLRLVNGELKIVAIRERSAHR